MRACPQAGLESAQYGLETSVWAMTSPFVATQIREHSAGEVNRPWTSLLPNIELGWVKRGIGEGDTDGVVHSTSRVPHMLPFAAEKMDYGYPGPP